MRMRKQDSVSGITEVTGRAVVSIQITVFGKYAFDPTYAPQHGLSVAEFQFLPSVEMW